MKLFKLLIFPFKCRRIISQLKLEIEEKDDYIKDYQREIKELSWEIDRIMEDKKNGKKRNI